MSAYTVAPLEERDLAEAAGIEKLCFSHPWSEETLRSEFGSPYNWFFGAHADEKLIGYCGMQAVAGEGSVFNVAVLPEYRRQGVGESLVIELLRKSKELGLDQLLLEVRPSNLKAIWLYEKCGFVFFGLRKNYYTDPPENAIIMRLAFNGTQMYEDDDDDD
jgi:ribosomal-protein-alanine N-acetyltransferase